ncbi:holo-[acyl-carrier-protein] synthase [Candidatus Cytomitobacter indipagum]|uniref:Holo-[acyl-carrier-protein] synthase n=1 Tax=Candidatus Cytomitobacter indipagum TaxID=2601575 RepID=A0A5C0UDK2_9PROT|nr:holo-ACP synthase [Candidatus Cytomitobacter indipagum]QEK38106.1 holo-[acyl-carrier-protein] synthase [Candidatus Cytomitobacter indipagum]
MIIGIGVDIINQDRMEILFSKYQNRLINKILSKKEIQDISEKNFNQKQIANFISKKFSATEAISKAIGTGVGSNCRFQDICLYKNELGKPFIEIQAKTHDYIINTFSKKYVSHVSFSDETINNNKILICNAIIESA